MVKVLIAKVSNLTRNFTIFHFYQNIHLVAMKNVLIIHLQ